MLWLHVNFSALKTLNFALLVEHDFFMVVHSGVDLIKSGGPGLLTCPIPATLFRFFRFALSSSCCVLKLPLPQLFPRMRLLLLLFVLVRYRQCSLIFFVDSYLRTFNGFQIELLILAKFCSRLDETIGLKSLCFVLYAKPTMILLHRHVLAGMNDLLLSALVLKIFLIKLVICKFHHILYFLFSEIF